jgi:hypothetical protein
MELRSVFDYHAKVRALCCITWRLPSVIIFIARAYRKLRLLPALISARVAVSHPPGGGADADSLPIRVTGDAEPDDADPRGVPTARGLVMRWELSAGNIRRSWAGAGSLEITGPDDHFELRDYVIVFVYVVTVDLIAYLSGWLLFARHALPVCGPAECFADPRTTIDHAWLYVWLAGAATVLTLAMTALWKTGRVVVAVMQAVVLAVVLILAVTTVIRAQGQLQELRLCHLGVDGPCIGAHRLS